GLFGGNVCDKLGSFVYFFALVIEEIVYSLGAKEGIKRISKTGLRLGEDFQHAKATDGKVVRAVATFLNKDEFAVANRVGSGDDHFCHLLKSILRDHLPG